MLEAEIYTVGMTRPEDVSGIAALFDGGEVDPVHVVAVIAQTEGDGHARGYSALCLRKLFADRLGLSELEIQNKLPLLMIGGTAGLMSPHFTLFVKKPAETQGVPSVRRLAIGVASTRQLLAEEFGTMAQLELVADAGAECANQAVARMAWSVDL